MKKLSVLVLCAMFLCMAILPVCADGMTPEVKEAYHALSAPVIDGQIDDLWQSVPQVYGYYGDEVRDITGYGRVLWDENYLYVLVVVDDDTRNSESNPGAESIDIFMDEMNTQTDGYTDDGEWGLTITPQGISYVTYVDGEFYSDREDLNSNVEFVIVDNGQGYLVEARIGYRSTNMEAKVGHIMGINFCFNNDTDDDGTRNEFASCTSADQPYWSNASFLTKFVFSEKSVGTAPVVETPEEITPEPEVIAPTPEEDAPTPEEDAPAPEETAPAPAIEEAPASDKPVVVPSTADNGILVLAVVAVLAFGIAGFLFVRYRPHFDM